MKCSGGSGFSAWCPYQISWKSVSWFRNCNRGHTHELIQLDLLNEKKYSYTGNINVLSSSSTWYVECVSMFGDKEQISDCIQTNVTVQVVEPYMPLSEQLTSVTALIPVRISNIFRSPIICQVVLAASLNYLLLWVPSNIAYKLSCRGGGEGEDVSAAKEIFFLSTVTGRWMPQSAFIEFFYFSFFNSSFCRLIGLSLWHFGKLPFHIMVKIS